MLDATTRSSASTRRRPTARTSSPSRAATEYRQDLVAAARTTVRVAPRARVQDVLLDAHVAPTVASSPTAAGRASTARAPSSPTSQPRSTPRGPKTRDIARQRQLRPGLLARRTRASCSRAPRQASARSEPPHEPGDHEGQLRRAAVLEARLGRPLPDRRPGHRRQLDQRHLRREQQVRERQPRPHRHATRISQLTAGPEATVNIHVGVARGNDAEDGYQIKQNVELPTPFKGDTMMARSGHAHRQPRRRRDTAARLRGRQARLRARRRRLPLHASRRSGRICMPGNKANFSFDERFLVTHHYLTREDFDSDADVGAVQGQGRGGHLHRRLRHRQEDAHHADERPASSRSSRTSAPTAGCTSWSATRTRRRRSSWARTPPSAQWRPTRSERERVSRAGSHRSAMSSRTRGTPTCLRRHRVRPSTLPQPALRRLSALLDAGFVGRGAADAADARSRPAPRRGGRRGGRAREPPVRRRPRAHPALRARAARRVRAAPRGR